jgi:hypothetical protein
VLQCESGIAASKMIRRVTQQTPRHQNKSVELGQNLDLGRHYAKESKRSKDVIAYREAVRLSQARGNRMSNALQWQSPLISTRAHKPNQLSQQPSSNVVSQEPPTKISCSTK